MTSVCSSTPLRTSCEAPGDRLNRSISSASASWSLSHYRWNPYDKVCPKAPITPTAESTPSTTASPIHFHLDLVPTIAFPLPVDLSPRTECNDNPLHLTKVFRLYSDPSLPTLQDSDDALTEDSLTDSAPVKVVEYRSYGIKVTKSTAAYREYVRQVPVASRKPADPSTPRPALRCSRKQWGMQMKQWRQALESYRF